MAPKSAPTCSAAYGRVAHPRSSALLCSATLCCAMHCDAMRACSGHEHWCARRISKPLTDASTPPRISGRRPGGSDCSAAAAEPGGGAAPRRLAALRASTCHVRESYPGASALLGRPLSSALLCRRLRLGSLARHAHGPPPLSEPAGLLPALDHPRGAVELGARLEAAERHLTAASIEAARDGSGPVTCAHRAAQHRIAWDAIPCMRCYGMRCHATPREALLAGDLS